MLNEQKRVDDTGWFLYFYIYIYMDDILLAKTKSGWYDLREWLSLDSEVNDIGEANFVLGQNCNESFLFYFYPKLMFKERKSTA